MYATSILAFATLALSAALPDPSTGLSPRKATRGTIQYCSSPSVCSTIQINNWDCHTFGDGITYSQFAISSGLQCHLYGMQNCDTAYGGTGRKSHLPHVKGTIDLKTDARAKKQEIDGGAGSFFCMNA